MSLIKIIEVHELKSRMEQNPDLCLIDVREQAEWDQGHIPQALLMPKDTIASCIEAQIPDKNQVIYLHCKSGVRSLYAAQILIELGYQEVYSVDGGIMKWAMCGYPVEQLVGV
jgi:rhodanese-related sulfurtransferase